LIKDVLMFDCIAKEALFYLLEFDWYVWPNILDLFILILIFANENDAGQIQEGWLSYFWDNWLPESIEHGWVEK
jgi:hypothetical protein